MAEIEVSVNDEVNGSIPFNGSIIKAERFLQSGIPNKWIYRYWHISFTITRFIFEAFHRQRLRGTGKLSIDTATMQALLK